MSELKVNKISPKTACGTTTLGDSGDTFTIPAGVTITNNGTQTGFGRTGTVDWQTSSIKTSTFTAVSGQGFFCDTNSGGFTCNLPAGSAGAIVSLQDYRNTFDTNALTIIPNGSEKINGGAGAVSLGTEGEGITLVYIDSTVGWRSIQDNDFAATGSTYVAASGGTETTCGDFKIHTFTGPGTFTVSASGAPAGSNTIEYLVVAGGGGGGYDIAGGGGAGGARFAAPSLAPLTYPAKPLAAPAAITASTGSFPITVGGGGAVTSSGQGCAGNPSVFSSITSTGGGGGGGNGAPVPERNGAPGGSGGGGGYNGCGASTGGTGNTPPVSPAQGTNGGFEDGYVSGGGGGGMIAAGSNAQGPNHNGGPGGDGGGFPTAFGANGEPCGSYRYYAGGGGGGGRTSPYGPGGTGGKGGAGDGVNTGAGNAGTANTGGGGGGSSGQSVTTGSAGGSGIVILRYKYQN